MQYFQECEQLRLYNCTIFHAIRIIYIIRTEYDAMHYLSLKSAVLCANLTDEVTFNPDNTGYTVNHVDRCASMHSSPSKPAALELYLPRTPLMSASETARVMGFSSTEALAKARLAGRLPIEMFKLPGRRGWFASTESVRAWLEHTLVDPSHSFEEGAQ